MGSLTNTVVSTNIFSSYVQKKSIFNDKRFLTASFVPDNILHRENEITQLSRILAPMLRGYQINNVFVYGTTGTGKTICCKYVISQLQEAAKSVGSRIITLYVNCKMKRVADTEYRLLAHMLKELGEFVPDTGLPTDVLYKKFFEKIEKEQAPIIIVLDEIDSLLRKIGDEFLYNFTRINGELKNTFLNIVGITNDVSFQDRLDMRVRSSLSEEDIIFKPYDAVQIKDILAERAVVGYNKDTIDDNVISLCAAFAAQEHGDARRALDLLRVAGELAERRGDKRVTEQHVTDADEKLDVDKTTETIKCQPRQSQAVLCAMMRLSQKTKNSTAWADKRLLTADVYKKYEEISVSNGMKPLTHRRISDLIAEFDVLGIINTKIISKGRYGRTREISLTLTGATLERVEKYIHERFC